MGATNERKGVIMGVCIPMMEFLRLNGIVQVVFDDGKDLIIYQLTRRAEDILRKALPDVNSEE